MTDRVAGAELARRLYEEHLAAVLPMPHAAAHLGWGSDVLGFDDARSTDHGFGPRLTVLVDADQVAAAADAIEAALPDDVAGWPTRFGWDDVPVTHHVQVGELGEWLAGRIGFDAREPIATIDWLLTPQQRLLEVTAGAVFHDDGRLGPVREALRWYPPDVWLWLLASQWRRIAQEESFAGRAAEVGDELGSRVITARLARDVMRLCFLLERRYAPYAKWLGSAFAKLDAARDVGPALDAALAAGSWAERENGLVAAYEAAARRFDGLGIAEPIDPSTHAYYTRPFRVIGGDRIVEACVARIEDPALRTLPAIGGIDQIVDSTDALDLSRRSAFAALYRGL
ncbi:MAG TPA: DUF4037 domain-containing protein [Gaiellaceae bacterium]|nr:DUF4037 domain-containing protein [Gaiellaceae bacterium]